MKNRKLKIHKDNLKNYLNLHEIVITDKTEDWEFYYINYTIPDVE